MLSKIIGIVLETLDVLMVAAFLYFLVWIVATIFNTLEERYGQWLSLLIFGGLCTVLVIITLFSA